jgi:hypothetical protein
LARSASEAPCGLFFGKIFHLRFWQKQNGIGFQNTYGSTKVLSMFDQKRNGNLDRTIDNKRWYSGVPYFQTNWHRSCTGVGRLSEILMGDFQGLQ